MPRRNRGPEIMRAAERLFTSRRFHEITLDDVAAEAHVGKGTIYRYFRDKDDLFFQTATWGFDELCDLLVRKVPGDGTFAQQLLSVCEHISAFFNRRRQLLRMMQSEEARMHWCRPETKTRWAEHRERLLSAMGQVLSRGMDEGAIRRDVPAEVLAAFLLGMLRTQARELGDWPQARQGLECAVSLFLHGAAPNGVIERPRT